MRTRAVRWSVLAAVLAAVAAGVAPPAAVRGQQQVAHFVRVGAWNIEHLGNPASRSGVGHNVAQTPKDLADYIRASGVDLLALEEIADDDQPGRRNKSIAAALADLKAQTGDEWDHLLTPKANPTAESQLVGVAWNKTKVKRVGEPFKVPVSSPFHGSPVWDRHPHAVKFSFGPGQTDVVLIPLHMKANTGGTPAPKVRREMEAQSLMQALAQVQQHTKDFDVVLLGDTNILKKTEKAALVFKANGFRDLNDEDETTHVGGAPFDRFFVPNNQPEFAGIDQVVFDQEFMGPRNLSTTDFRRRFSDHFMVVSRVRVLQDDDN